MALAQIETGLVKKALIIGAEKLTAYMNWTYRQTAVLFGDGSGAVVLEATEEGRVKPGNHLLLTAFGAGLSVAAVALRWGKRVTPVSTTDKDLPPCDKTLKEMISPFIDYYAKHFVDEE